MILERLGEVDHRCEHLLPGRSVHIVAVVLDAHAIRLRYAITPTLPTVRPERGDRPAVHWSWSAIDDHSNAYTEAGGAYGLSADGHRTEGVFSFQPLPPPDAHRLTVSLSAEVDGATTPTACEFAVNLPSRD